MPLHRVRVGLHARNDVIFTSSDYSLVRQAGIETLKMMSHTAVSVFQRLRQDNPQLELIVRLYDDRVRNRSRPDPTAFVHRMGPIIARLKPYATKFEIHNEPNHAAGLEGWGASDADARAFLGWYMKVLDALKQAYPWAQFGFPGLAIHNPHRDLQWLDICRDGVLASDWLGCHCYWQYGNMLSDDWGLRFKLYHKRFRNMRIEITEFGDSTPNLAPAARGREYVRFYQELNKHFYLGSACAFIASSPDPAWAPFAWMREGGQMQPVVQAVANMERKPVEVVLDRFFEKTGKTVSGVFLDFFDRLGADICGSPITEQIKENGKPAQYFERVAMELVKPGKIQLKTVGSEALASRARIAQLQTLVDKLSVQPLPSVEKIIDGLSSQTASLAQQIQVLQLELTKAEEAAPGAGTDLSAWIASLREQIKALQGLSDSLHAELALALKAMSEAQTELVTNLKARIQALEEELKKREVQPPEPPATKITKPAMQDIVARLPKHSTERYATRATGEIQTLVIHHSATPATVTPEAIARYHVNSWHWPGIGYHFIVASDGTVYQTNTVETVSYHASSANAHGVGVCFLGSFMQQGPPRGQIQAGAHLVAWLLQELHLTTAAVKGHRELMQTACPGDQWLGGSQWKKALLKAVASMQK